jgi:hypothetical protein
MPHAERCRSSTSNNVGRFEPASRKGSTRADTSLFPRILVLFGFLGPVVKPEKPGAGWKPRPEEEDRSAFDTSNFEVAARVNGTGSRRRSCRASRRHGRAGFAGASLEFYRRVLNDLIEPSSSFSRAGTEPGHRRRGDRQLRRCASFRSPEAEQVLAPKAQCRRA